MLQGFGFNALRRPPARAALRKPYWLPPRYFVNGTGTQTVATSQHFSGTIARYSIRPGHAQVSINASTGVISVTTATDFAWKEFVVRATKTDGTHVDAPIELRVLTGTKQIDLGASEAYWSVTPVPGDIVIVRQGTSSERWFLDGAAWDGTAGSPVELVAYPGERCTIDCSALTGTDCVYIESNNLIVRGLEIIGGVNTGIGIDVWKSTNITIEQCRVHNAQRFGIVFSTDALGVSTGNKARYNYVYDNVKENDGRDMGSGWATGLRSDGDAKLNFSRNVVWNNYGEGIGLLACYDAVAKENLAYDNFSVNLYLDGVRGVDCARNVLYATNSAYYKGGGATPANSILAANEDYADFREQTSYNLKVYDNHYISSNVAPFYDASFGLATGGGPGTQFQNNLSFAAVDSLWPALKTPAIVTRANGATSASDTTSHVITMPASIVPGNMLVVHLAIDGNPTVTVDTGASGSNWKKLGQSSNSTVVTGAIFWKIAEGGDALTLTSSASEQSSHTSLQISDALSIQGTPANGSSTNSDPPNLAPTWSIGGYSVPCLWIATRAGDSTVLATVAPTNYGNLQSQAAAGTGGASSNTAERTLSAASENPGTFTSASEQWVSYTLAVSSLPV